MVVEIEITREDFADFNRYYFVKRGLKYRIVIVIIVSLLLPILILWKEQLNLLNYLFYVFLSLVIFGGFYIGMLFLFINRSGRIPAENG